MTGVIVVSVVREGSERDTRSPWLANQVENLFCSDSDMVSDKKVARSREKSV